MEHLQFQLQTRIAEFTFKQITFRQQKQWLGATRINRMSKYSTSPVVMLLKSWDLPLDEKTLRRLSGIESLPELLESFMLKGVRLDSHMGLWGLLSGNYRLFLRRDIPRPLEMLDRQCLGERYVTYLDQPEDLEKPVGRFAGAFEFLMHDLEHAHKFFGDPELFRGQVNFFNLLRRILPRLAGWQDDALFEKDLNYLMSDMNSHPVHLFKYLKAIVLTAELRRGHENQAELDSVWNDVLEIWKTPEKIRRAALRINRPGLETGEDQILMYDFFRSAFEPPRLLC